MTSRLAPTAPSPDAPSITGLADTRDLLDQLLELTRDVRRDEGLRRARLAIVRQLERVQA